MALTNCRECGNQVSTLAVACPHCGAPQPGAPPQMPPKIIVRQPPPRLSPPLKKRNGLFRGCLFLFLGVCAIGAIVVITRQAAEDTSNPSTAGEKADTGKTAPRTVRNDPVQEPMASPHYGLSSISVDLQDKLIHVLNQTDELDTLFKRGCTPGEYRSAGAPIEKAAMDLQHALPANDPRIYLFLGTIEKYQLVAVKMTREESKEELTATAVLAAVNKVLLLKVLNGTLNENEEETFNYIKLQIQSGKM